MKLYLTVVLIYIFLVTNNIEHLFIGHLSVFFGVTSIN